MHLCVHVYGRWCEHVHKYVIRIFRYQLILCIWEFLVNGSQNPTPRVTMVVRLSENGTGMPVCHAVANHAGGRIPAGCATSMCNVLVLLAPGASVPPFRRVVLFLV